MIDRKRKAFLDQRSKARQRGIEFKFSYAEWVAWWGDDMSRRGLRSHDLVMARLSDAGPYEVGNVRKLTQAMNKLDVIVAPSRARGYHHLIP